MVIAGDISHIDIPVSCFLDLPGGEDSIGIAIDQKRKHHMRGHLLAPRSPMIDLKDAERQPIYRFDDEVNQIVVLDPIAQIGRKQHWSIAVYIYELGSHRFRLPDFQQI